MSEDGHVVMTTQSIYKTAELIYFILTVHNKHIQVTKVKQIAMYFDLIKGYLLLKIPNLRKLTTW